MNRLPSSVSYTFGPGPMTPAVRAIVYTNVAMFVLTLISGTIVRWLG